MAASFTIGTLVNWNIQGHLLSIVPVTALLAFLVTVMPSRSAKSHQLIPSFDIRDATIPLSLRVIFILMVAQCAQMIAFGYFGGDAIAIVIRGLTKASSWYFMMQTVCGVTIKHLDGVLSIFLGSTIFLEYCNNGMDIQYYIYS